MENPLDRLEAEMALEQIHDIPQAVVDKVQRVTRAAALAALSEIVSDESQDLAMRIGAANVILMATSAVNTETDFFRRNG